MCLKFAALLGCQFWEKGLSVTNPVYFVPVCGGENLAWHQMPLNRCFYKQRQKMAASSSSSLLVSCLTSTLNLSRLSYICQELGLYLTLLPWLQLLYGTGHVFTVYIMGCWEKRGRTGVLVPFGATFKCVRLCVFLMLGSCPLLFSGSYWEQEAIWRDGHHNSNSNWMGCTVNAQWPRACGPTTWLCFCEPVHMSVVC